MTSMALETSDPVRCPDDLEAWHAVVARDATYDGRFVYAVRSTRIYCRPSCPSRRPLRKNVCFFDAPGAARLHGYRPCMRCAPDDGPGGSAARAVENARTYLDENAERSVSLAELSVCAGISVSHLRRTFKRAFGLTPREYQSAARLARFKGRLRSGDSVSRATYEAGFGSSSRVYERSGVLLGMTPATYRSGGKGVVIQYAISDGPLGRVLVATTERGVCAVELGDTDSEVEDVLRADFPNATIERAADEHAVWVRAVLDRIRDPGHLAARSVPLDLDGTAFQRQVWKALQSIPVGERRSYGELAASIGRPTATRAVARACATNRVAVVIPCHRVVRTDGEMAGYKWGVHRKRRLLEDEAR